MSQDTELALAMIRRDFCIRSFNSLFNSINEVNQDVTIIPLVHAQFTELPDKVNNYEKLHSLIMAHPSNISKTDELMTEYDDVQKLIINIKAKYNAPPFIVKNDISLDINHVTQNDMSNTGFLNSTTSSINTRLPKLDLPKFSGAISEWSSFYDLFLSSVHDNDRLQPVQKFQYLKSVLIDEPLALIRNLSLTDANYTSALTILTDRYNRKRLISSYHLKALLDLPALTSLSYEKVNSFYHPIKEHISALKSAQAPIDHWSQILAFILVNKFDKETRNKFERTLSQDELPELDNVFVFLDKFIISQQWQTVDQNQPEISHTAPKFRKPSRNLNMSTFVTTTVNLTCPSCNQSHTLSQCSKFKQLSPQERFNIVRSVKYCFNCLGTRHMLKDCMSKNRCRTCNSKHHSLLHLDTRSFPRASNMHNVSHVQKPVSPPLETQHVIRADVHTPSSDQGIANVPTTSLVHTTSTFPFRTLLSTALISVMNVHGKWHNVRALLDSGSEASYVTTKCFESLSLPHKKSNIVISGFSNVTVTKVTGVTELRIRAHNDHNATYTLKTLIVPHITCDLPKQQVPTDILENYKHLSLADPEFGTPGPIDVLIGADIYFKLLTGHIISNKDFPCAVGTKLGWLISGSLPSQPNTTIHSLVTTLNNDVLSDSLVKFWETEETPISHPKSSDEQLAEDRFLNCVSRDSSGRYIVPLLFKEFPPPLGDSYTNALRAYKYLRTRLLSDEPLRVQYSKFMNEYLDLGHMSALSTDNRNEGFYLPHHGVLRHTGNVNKLRVVFNGSKRTSNNISLNDTMLKGPALQTHIATVLTRARRHRYIFTADVRHMYRQILVLRAHRVFQKILWNPDLAETPQVFSLNTVTYGTKAAPFLALRTMQLLASDERHNFPDAASVILDDTYIDDIISGADTLEDAIALVNQLINLLSKAGLELSKWTSNNPHILAHISQENCEHSFLDHMQSGNPIKLLGLQWNPSRDFFTYTINLPDSSNSKRSILSHVAQIFDPLGWLTPTVMIAKLLLQELWKTGLAWDDPVPDNLNTRWNQFREQLPLFSRLQIPRFIDTAQLNTDLIGFCDASEKGYAAVVYIHTHNESSSPHVSIVTAKSRVAPLKCLTLPRLELCAALLLSRLLFNIVTTSGIRFSHIYAWSDSKVALSWIRSPPYRWKTFVSNRVAEIQRNVSIHCWHHVRSQDNPADCASRSITPKELINHPLWWQGPSWLLLPHAQWPLSDPGSLNEKSPSMEAEEKIVLLTQLNPPNSLLTRYSTLEKLLRITVLCVRFMQKCCRVPNVRTTRITSEEIDQALLLWISIAQADAFSEDVNKLKSGRLCSTQLQKLNPFLDNIGLIRVGGRLRNAGVPYEHKHPVLLPSKHKLTGLIIDQYHKRYLHPSPRTLQAILSRRFWILASRRVVRSYTSKCITCFRCKPISRNPLMGDLPPHRVLQLKPFDVIGVDYGGPFFITPYKGRGIKSFKAYLCLFVCFSTKAVHLELATDLTTQAFIAAFQRFLARRGPTSHIYSDAGTNFLGAKRYFTDLQKFIASNSFNNNIFKHFANNGISWHINPPTAAHFGGLWEAAIKSVKFHLNRVVGSQILTYEELSTVLCLIESVLNSRPLCPVSTDPNDLEALSPNHFLTHSVAACLPERDFLNENPNLLTRWQLVQKMHQDFWKRWHSEYLSTLQARSKWFKNTPDIPINSLVLIKDNTASPLDWRLGRVTQLFPGPDNICRVAKVHTSRGDILRPFVKLCLLPMN